MLLCLQTCQHCTTSFSSIPYSGSIQQYTTVLVHSGIGRTQQLLYWSVFLPQAMQNFSYARACEHDKHGATTLSHPMCWLLDEIAQSTKKLCTSVFSPSLLRGRCPGLAFCEGQHLQQTLACAEQLCPPAWPWLYWTLLARLMCCKLQRAPQHQLPHLQNIGQTTIRIAGQGNWGANSIC